MPNPQYRKGARGERIVRAYLEQRGYLVQRQYASKGAFDLLAVPPGGGAVLLVEVKTGKGHNKQLMTPKARQTLVDMAATYAAVPVAAHYDQGHIAFWHLLSRDVDDRRPLVV